MLDFRIATFLKLCETKSYTKTAKMLNITQPSVTQHIKYLQRKYDCKLFIYEGKTLSLTPEGEYVRTQAEAMTRMCAKVVSDLQRMKDNQNVLRFGCASEIGEAVVTRVIGKMMASKPERELSLCIKSTPELLKMLVNGQLDVILADESYKNNKFISSPMTSVKYAVYASPELAQEYDKPSLKSLMEERLIVRERGLSDRDALEYYLMQKGFLINEFYDVMTVNTAISLQELSATGAGIVFAYASSVQDAVAQNRLQEVALSDFSEERRLAFLYCKDDEIENDEEDYEDDIDNEDNMNNIDQNEYLANEYEQEERFSEFFQKFKETWNEEFTC
ncbi:MAG: LysR family transcriptional regulator [Oscillospiraceae bacterium]|nr:LysR family transcriptional regulator [Oscillospiraceae bacterium]